MSKFFIDKQAITGDNITIAGGDARHIGRVLRMKAGDEITVCDGEGRDYRCRIESFSKDEVFCRVTDVSLCPAEPRIHLSLYQCLPKAGKMEQIVQKAVELGASRIVPVLAHRCVAREEKAERWQKVALEAAKQCGRGIVPVVASCMRFDEAVAELCTMDAAIFPYEAAACGAVLPLSGKVSSVGIMIGPEGGFEKSEADKAASLGASVVTLGKRILRTETAGAAVIAIVMNACGEMR